MDEYPKWLYSKDAPPKLVFSSTEESEYRAKGFYADNDKED